MNNVKFVIDSFASFSTSDYKVWIDIERGANMKCHLNNMVELNMMEEKFCAHRMAERKRVAYFAMQHEMDCEEYKEK
jgi:hypothetical protein